MEIVSSISDGINKLDRPPFYDILFQEELKTASFLTYYTSPSGHEFVRRALQIYERCLADSSEKEINEFAKNICITNGATSGIFYYFQYMSNKRALFLGHHYIHFKIAAESNNVEYQVLVSNSDDRIAPEIHEIAEIISQFDFVTLTLPFNPSGEMYSKNEFEQLLSLCVRHNVHLLIDKCQWDEIILSKNEEYYSLGNLIIKYSAQDLVTIINSFSKIRSIPSARFGYALGPKPIIDQMVLLNNLVLWHPSVVFVFPILIDLVAQISCLTERGWLRGTINYSLQFRHAIMKSYQNKDCMLFLINCIAPESLSQFRMQLENQLFVNQCQIQNNYKYLIERIKDYNWATTQLRGGFNVYLRYPNPNNLTENECKEKIHRIGKLYVLTHSDFCGDGLETKSIWIRITLAAKTEAFKQMVDALIIGLL